jgi:predicted transcriptional regulator
LSSFIDLDIEVSHTVLGDLHMPSSKSDRSDPLDLAAGIVSAFVAHNSLPRAELPAFIQSVFAAVTRNVGGADTLSGVEPVAPAVTERKSVTPDYLICLDDGGKFKTLRRHLAGLGMTPEQYRAKWNLPDDYPMVAPNYAAQRSALAKGIGLGQLRNGDGVGKREPR